MIRNSLGIFDITQNLGSIVAFEVRGLFCPYQQHLNTAGVND